MMQRTIEQERDATSEAVSQITAFCIIIAMHQKYTVGSVRIERVVRHMDEIRKEYVALLVTKPKVQALKFLRDKLPTGARAEFFVPLNRWKKNRREEQMRMAANDAASIAWLLFAVALHEVLGFGKDRLEGVRREAIANYRQFNEWCLEDKDWALDRLRRCAEAALHEHLAVTDEEDPRRKIADDDLLREDRQAIALAVSCELGAMKRPDGWAVLNPAKLAEKAQAERFAPKTKGVQYGIGRN